MVQSIAASFPNAFNTQAQMQQANANSAVGKQSEGQLELDFYIDYSGRYQSVTVLFLFYWSLSAGIARYHKSNPKQFNILDSMFTGFL